MEHVSGSVGQIGQVSGIEPDADGSVAEVAQRHSHSAEVEQSTPVIIHNKNQFN